MNERKKGKKKGKRGKKPGFSWLQQFWDGNDLGSKRNIQTKNRNISPHQHRT